MNASFTRRFIFIPLALAPALILYAFFVFVPVIWSSYYSLFKWSGMGDATFIGLQNYIELVNDDIFWRALKNNVIFVFASVLGQVPLALLLAIVLFKNHFFQRLLRTAVFMPMVLSTVVIGMIWNYIYHSQIGILNSVLDFLNLEVLKMQWLSDPNIAIYSLIPPLIWSYVGLYLILFVSALQNIPSELNDAAKIDGATGLMKFFKITLPMIWGTIQVAIILCISGSLKSFDLVYIMTKGGPAHTTELLATYMYNATFSTFRYGYGSTISTAIVIISLLLIGVSQWVTNKSK